MEARRSRTAGVGGRRDWEMTMEDTSVVAACRGEPHTAAEGGINGRVALPTLDQVRMKGKKEMTCGVHASVRL